MLHRSCLKQRSVVAAANGTAAGSRSGGRGVWAPVQHVSAAWLGTSPHHLVQLLSQLCHGTTARNWCYLYVCPPLRHPFAGATQSSQSSQSYQSSQSSQSLGAGSTASGLLRPWSWSSARWGGVSAVVSCLLPSFEATLKKAVASISVHQPGCCSGDQPQDQADRY